MNTVHIYSSQKTLNVQGQTQVLEDEIPLSIFARCEKLFSDASFSDTALKIHKITETVCFEVAHFTLNIEKIDNIELTIRFSSEVEIQTLNSQFRNISESTDVLSFSYKDDKNGNEGNDVMYLGDLNICPEYVVKQAKSYNQKYITELIRVTIHGILHLCGYVHKSYKSTDPMLVYQEKIVGLFTDIQHHKSNMVS